MTDPIHIISLGAGVQSSTMALMAAHGEIEPMPKWAVFADTGWESTRTYEWLDVLQSKLPFPVKRVSKGNIREENVRARINGRKVDGHRWASLPYFVRTEKPIEGRVKRQCTTEYKIEPVENWMKREVLGLPKGSRLPSTPAIIQWRGISTDEVHRMKDSGVGWYQTRFPLAMELRMNRQDCLIWLTKHGYEKPLRSACIGCPFHSDAEWLDMKRNRPEEWRDAIAFDAAIRKARGMRGDSYLHRSLVPLDEVRLKQRDPRQADMFGNECEGMCGV